MGRAGWRWILNTMGLWSDESVGTARGLEMVHSARAMSRTLGEELCGK